MPKENERDRIGIPVRVFFYTPDQIATMLELEVDYVKNSLLFYEGRQPGLCPKSKMRAINVAKEGDVPQWRISENTFLGYLRSRGVKFYNRGYMT